MNATTYDPNQLNNDEIERLAHSIWEKEGRPEGRSLEHWLMAEEQLRSQTKAGSLGVMQQASVVAARENPSIRKNRANQASITS